MRRALYLTALAAALAGCAAGMTGRGAHGETASRDEAISPSTLSREQVRLVQRSLAQHGLVVDVNGTFDDRTRTALLEFQRARSLPESGALDGPTLEELGIDPREVTPVRAPAHLSPDDVVGW
jgi:hypothetical protein